MTTLEAQAKQKLYLKQIYIENKFFKLSIEAEDKVKLDKQKALAKAERQVKQRLINQEKKIKNKQREKENKVREKQWKPLLKIRKPKPKKINHMKLADFYFSRCIRSMRAQELSKWMRYDKDVVTWQVLLIKDLTCWHYITRWTYTTRYHVGNCACQSHWTNKAEHRNPKRKYLFREALVKLHWEHVVEEVETLAKQWKQSDNKKVNFEEEHKFWKNEYETKYKSMRE